MALHSMLFTLFCLGVGALAAPTDTVRTACIRAASNYEPDWPLAAIQSGGVRFWDGVSADTLARGVNLGEINACMIQSAGQPGRINSSDLVNIRYVGEYRQQPVIISLRAAAFLSTTGQDGNLGLAAPPIVCYKWASGTTPRIHSCNILAQHAQLQYIDNNTLSTNNYTAFADLTGTLNVPREPIVNTYMSLTRQQLSLGAGSISMTSVGYKPAQLGLRDTVRSNGLNVRASVQIDEVADITGINDCNNSVVFLMDITGQSTGGVSFGCRTYKGMQIYASGAFFFAANMQNLPGCAPQVMRPYAVASIGAREDIQTIGYLTVSQDTTTETSLTNNTITCVATASGNTPDQQLLDIYGAQAYLLNISTLTHIATINATYSTVSRGTSIECGRAFTNTIGGSVSNNAVVTTVNTAGFSIDALSDVFTVGGGWASANSTGKICKLVPTLNSPGTVGGNESDAGIVVHNAVLALEQYITSPSLTPQLQTMGNALNAAQQVHSYGALATTCIATLVAAISAPVFKIGRFANTDGWRDITRWTGALAVLVLELMGCNIAAILRMSDLASVHGRTIVYSTETSDPYTYTAAYYNYFLVNSVDLIMVGRVSGADFKQAVLAFTILVATVTLIWRWSPKDDGGYGYNKVLQLLRGRVYWTRQKEDETSRSAETKRAEICIA